MFKTAATKLAHNSTIPALAGNSDLKPLQEVIATEKVFLHSLQKLSTDIAKSAVALRDWASGEGEDLGDTFSACATLLNHWAVSLGSFASHITDIRECLKAVRTREEALDEMHRRRKSLMSKADAADRKVSKMSPEHKNFRQQTDLLSSLREQISTLDAEILDEEANIGDWKRVKAMEWMGVLFGSLLECSEKGAVVATFGRTIVGYVSTEKTKPGLPRAHYSSHSQVEELVVEAERELHKISFTSEVGALQSAGEFRIGDIHGLPPSPGSSIPPTLMHAPQSYTSSTLPSNAPSNPPSNPYELGDFGDYNPYSRSQTYTSGQRTRFSSIDQPSPVSPTRSTAFAPFPPPQEGSGFTPGYQPRLSQSSIPSGSGFTPDHKPFTDDAFSTSIAKALGDEWSLNENKNIDPPRLSVDGPPPSYANNNFSTSGPSYVERKPIPTYIPEEDDEGVGLSYLNQTNDDAPGRRSNERHFSDTGSGFGEDKKVRWGSVRDVDMELEKRYAEETTKIDELRRSVSPGQSPETPSPVYRLRTPSPPMPQPHPYVRQPIQVHHTESPASIDESQPLPNVSVEDEGPDQLDERSLNALAAREIGKQMEMSSSPLSPPSLPFAGRRSVSPRPSFTTGVPPDNGSRFGQIPSPPPPPPQFTNSTVIHEPTPSPHPSRPPPPSASPLHPSQSMDSGASDLTQPDDAYRTPPEYLGNLSTPPSPSVTPVSPQPAPQTISALSSQPSTPTTTKKISAAAFRRPGMRGLSSNTNLKDGPPRQDSLSMGFRQSPGRSPSRERGNEGNGDGSPDLAVTPLNLRKKSLPMVPANTANTVDSPRSLGGSRSISSPFPNLRANDEKPLRPGRVPPLSSPPESRPQESVLGGDDDFDYLTAYLNDDDRRQSGMPNGATNGRGPVGGGPGTGPPQNVGYGSGMFATRLED